MFNSEIADRQSWIRMNSHGSVLDVGCGESAYFWNGGRHIEKDIEYLGFDMFREPETSDFDVPENFMIADGHEIPVKDNQFDTVVVGEILEHCKCPVRVIKESARVSDSTLLITVTDEDGWSLDLDFSDLNYGHPERKYSRVKLVKQCAEAGLEITKGEVMYTEDFPLAFWLAEFNV